MPFFWTEWMTAHGSIAGNRAAGSRFGITNTHRFSYPGYAEILTGEPHDAVIDSNDNRRYPFPTLLDVLKRRLSLSREQVAAFGSWETFRWIISSQEDAFVVNAGYQAFASDRPDVQRLSRAQFETQTPWDSVRNDMYTFRLALAHLQTARPRVAVPGAGRDRRLGARRALRPRAADARAHRRLVQGTVDLAAGRPAVSRQHRRSSSPSITAVAARRQDWGKHGDKVDGAQETWLAAIGPDWPRRGEWTNAPDAFTNQIAATGAKVARRRSARRHPERRRAD